MSAELKKHVTSKDTWLRALFMVMYAIIWWVSQMVLGVVVLIQFFTVLFTGKSNEALLSFGDKLSEYFHDLARYLTFNQDEKPFPFSSAGAADKPHKAIEH